MEKVDYDVFVIGGGINGCGFARDAAGRGFKVGLAEMNDLASGTSSTSTKLIHGGLRYLEQYEFRLVREALKERDVIWKIAPHIAEPLRFILPYHKQLRPLWMLRLGLFIYDHLGGKILLKKTNYINLSKQKEHPLKSGYDKGFEYSDERIDDSRLVVLNARHAKMLGADILLHTKVKFVIIKDNKWHIELYDKNKNKTFTVTASFIANMAGPWINHILQDVTKSSKHPPIRLVQGSHIVVPKIYEHDRAYIFQNADGRIIFAIPYNEDFTLIGTTDRDYQGDPAKVAITNEEIDYLCAAASEYFIKPVKRDMIIWSYSGVRPLYDDGAANAQKTTRDYVLRLADEKAELPLLNVYGGKITTYRKLAEDALHIVEKHLGKRKDPWTDTIPLPGGDFPCGTLANVAHSIKTTIPNLDDFTVRRLAKSYGTDAIIMFEQNNKSLGKEFGKGLYEFEINWLIKEEWAQSVEDVLWRRSKLGLWFNESETKKLEQYLHNVTSKICA